jgi:hypothetical protein
MSAGVSRSQVKEEAHGHKRGTKGDVTPLSPSSLTAEKRAVVGKCFILWLLLKGLHSLEGAT